ncbi:MAG: SUMF1/EgtB/PvdO family nonheme iron enzyme [Acidiferrobacterales bacterium]|jgi:iron(II)-dependent oxidoreductase|nr:SUMF1/EgtB/PvdO family nonheme iron enzyme [Acidiferrobacterales bacterium]
MTGTLLSDLGQRQQQLLSIIDATPEVDCYRQFHPDLSPLAWHLGHCAFIESYWISDRVLGNDRRTRETEPLYFPELSPKTKRAARMPGKSELLAQAKKDFAKNISLLAEIDKSGQSQALLANGYLLYFLLQHHCQHLETMAQILQQRAYQQDWQSYEARGIDPVEPSGDRITVDASNVEIGNPNEAIAYDNERPVWSTTIDSFGINKRPVSNSEYLGFMRADGYQNKDWWSPRGWHWRQSLAIDAPDHWRQDTDGNWYSLTATGPANLGGDDAVYGISFFEAEAYSHYADGRLPHELEWEMAAARQVIAPDQAWEWCSNHFFPYPGFHPFPYDGYSLPWFDDQHQTLRGASLHTLAPVRRPTFRNFYTPEKRHVFAGVRVAFDLD